MSDTCQDCGADMMGDGYTTVFHCEHADADGFEPDANPVYCGWSLQDDLDHYRATVRPLGVRIHD